MQLVALPLPFSAALIAGIVTLRVLSLRGGHGSARLFFASFFALLALQAVLSGLKFSYSIALAAFVQPVLAMLVGPLAFHAFKALGQSKQRQLGWWTLLHAFPPLLVVAIRWFNLPFPIPLDLLIWSSFFFYAILLIRTAREGPDSFEDFSTDDMRSLDLVRLAIIVLLLLISTIDILIYLDLAFWYGGNTGFLIAAGSLLLILLSISVLLLPSAMGLFSIGLARSSPVSEVERTSEHASKQDQELLHDLNAAMDDRRSFLDANINITRLGKQLNVPSRAVSGAINRCLGINFSQYINRYRVREACRLLKETDTPVTEIIFESGFQTKSNFNREFRRAMGMSPSDYRRGIRTDYLHESREILPE